MIEDQKITPRLSDRFSDLFGSEEPPEENVSPRGYIEESRKLSLNKLLHLAPYSDVLLLQGGQGVGRTSLLKAFIERAATNWRISYVGASTLMNGNTFLRQIGKGFELSLDSIESEDDLLWEIDRFLHAIGRSGRRAIIIVDDAHLLSDDVIMLMEKILRDERTEDCVSLLLSMRQDQGGKLDRFALLKERLSYTLTLEPLNKQEVEAYLRHRLAAANPEATAMLNDDLISSVYEKSGGIPEEIDALLHGLLAGRKTSKPNVSRAKPILVGAAVAGVGIVAAVILYYQEEINRLFEVPAEQQATVNVENQASATADNDDQLASVVTQMSAVSNPDAAVAMVHLENDESLPISVPIDDVLDEAANAEVLPEGIELAVVPESQPVVPAMIAPRADSPLTVQPEPEKQPEKVAALTVESKSVPEPTSEPAPTPEPPPEPELPADVKWLFDQPANHYSMQMMALADKNKVLNFVKKWKIADQSATFPITRRGKTLTVLVYGSYPNRAAADNAAKSLPKSWGVGQPWVRRFSGILKDYERQ